MRRLSDRHFDWEDVVAAGLAWVGHSLTGGFGRLSIPSTDHVRSLPPSGHGPALEPLLSSSRMRLEHGEISLTRIERVAWLAENAPELLPLLKVCFSADRSDNCGRCEKCLLTMAALRAAGALELATGFPSELDLDAVASERHRLITGLMQVDAIREAAQRAGDTELAEAADVALRESLAMAPVPVGPRTSFRALHTIWLRNLLGEGGAGLVQGCDPHTRRYVHVVGSRRPFR